MTQPASGSLNLQRALTNQPLICVDSQASWANVVNALAASGADGGPPCLLVWEAERPRGIITATDLLRQLSQTPAPEGLRAEEIMSAPLISVTLEQLQEPGSVLALLRERRLSHLPVLDAQGRPLGYLTPQSLLQALDPGKLYELTQALQAKVSQLESEKTQRLEWQNRQLTQTLRLQNTALGNSDLLEQVFQNKSAKEEALRSLAESEQRFRQLAANIEQVFYLTDIQTNQILYLGPQYEKIWQRSCASLYANPRSYLDALRPEDQPLALEAYQAQRQGQQTAIEYRIRRPDGTERWILDRCFPVKDEGGRVYRVCGIAEDITERKALELRLQELNQTLERQVEERTQELAKSEERWQLALAGSNDGIWDWDAENNTVFFSPRWKAMLGYGEAEISGRREEWIERVHPEDWPQVAARLQAHFNRETDFYSSEHRLRTKDGAYKWILDRGKAIWSAEGKMIRMAGSHTDITERKEMETRLARQLAAIDAASDGIGVADDQGVYIYLNQTHVRLFGYERVEDMLGKTWQELYLPEEVERIYQEVFPQLQSQGHWQGEAVARRRDGSLFDQEFSLTLVEGVGLICVCRDISERKRQERLLWQRGQQEHLLRAIGDRIRQSLELREIFATTTQEIRQLTRADRVGIFKFAPQSNYTEGGFVAESVEPGWGSILQAPLESRYLGREVAALGRQGGYLALEDGRTAPLEEGQRQTLERFQIRASLVFPILTGQKLWGLLCLHQCSGPRVWQTSEIQFIQQIANQLGIALQQAILVAQLRRELAQRREAQSRLQKSYQDLELSNLDLAQANRRTEEFLAAMSHELRTPLNAILGISQSLRENLLGELTPEQNKGVNTILRSGEHLLSLINDILDLSKIKAGKLELELETVHLQDLCRSSLQMVQQSAFQKQIRLESDLPPQTLYFRADSRRLRQVLINLLNNAVKFTPKGGQVFFSAGLLTQEPPQLVFIVRDTGIGIAEADLAKLFQPFVQVDSRLNRQYEGTGLGLALVKRLAELHGGQVTVVSQVGQGSAFTVTLPFRPAAGTPAPSSKEEEEAVGAPPIASPLVLVAEDNIANRESLENYLEYKGYRLIFAENGEEAIAQAREHKPDLILMDIQMPVMDGLEAARRLRREPEFAQLPIIALTALTMAGDRELCLEAGMDDYVTKPIQFRRLLLAMEKLLQAKRPENPAPP
ncbi:MAG: PAS domain S-box protein [Cyanobacteria bacterium RI_101]|nr:PAS domain S-box protein [Cyanobacteria bacterium RI_101]